MTPDVPEKAQTWSGPDMAAGLARGDPRERGEVVGVLCTLISVVVVPWL